MCALGAPPWSPANRRLRDAPGMRRRDVKPTERISPRQAQASLRFHFALVFSRTETRAHVRLLGPCFKTGRMESQPNSPPTPAPAAKLTAKASYRRRWRTAGSPRRLKPHRARHQRCQRFGSPGQPARSVNRTDRRQNIHCRGASSGKPGGPGHAALNREGEHRRQPAHRTRTSRARCQRTWKHSPRAARKPLFWSQQVVTSYWGSRTNARAGTSTCTDTVRDAPSIPRRRQARTQTAALA
jgi:hypothetical protein